MKIKGMHISPPEPVVIVIPRKSGNIVFKAQPVLSFDEFEALCPEPQPPEVLRPGNIRYKNVKDKKYLGEINSWHVKRSNWMMIKSLEATEDLVWEQVDITNPETWGNFQKEFKYSGFSIVETSTILNAIMEACGLNQEKIDMATKSFLAGQVVAPGNALSQDLEQSATPSGEPASE